VAILTKKRFPVGEYNNLAARKVGPVEIIAEINVKYLVPFIEHLSDEDANSRTNSLQPGKDDVDQIASNFMRMNGNDISMKTPQRIVTRLQTRKTGEDRPDGLSDHLDP
jgi:hypothetical protein